MTNLSDLFPAGAGKQVSFVASGTLSSGQAVGLTSDGKVAALSSSVGPEDVFQAAASYPAYNTVYDSNAQKVVVPYDTGGTGHAVVASVSGNTVTHGTPVALGTGSSGYISAAFDSSNNKVVIACQDYNNSQYGTAIIGTVSGTSISFGTPIIFNSAQTLYTATAFDSNNNRIAIGYRNGGNSDYGTAIVGTVSGTSISFGSATVFESAQTNYLSATFDSNSNKVVFCYTDGGNSNYGTSIVGTVTTGPDAISFGSAVIYESVTVNYGATTFDSNSNKVVHAYSGTSEAGRGVVGTVSGTSISFGTPVTFQDKAITFGSAFDTSANQVIIAYRYQVGSGTRYGRVVKGTVSGTSISFSTPENFSSLAIAYEVGVAYDANANRSVISFQQAPNDYGTSVSYNNDAFEPSNFIGITDAAISDTASGNVTIKGGISTNVTGLTPGSDYYVQGDGSISTTSTSPAVKIGKALSATAINLEYTS